MRSMKKERGAALVLIIGVIAALAILAATLVVLTANATSNTARDRSRAKAFNVAEAAIDYGLYRLGAAWPTASGQAITFSDNPDKTAFLGRFPASEFPSADVQVVWFNDVDLNGDGKIDLRDGDTNFDKVTNSLDQPQDTDNNGRMFIEAQATVGKRRARIQVEAQRNVLDTQIPRGIAIVCDGTVTANNKKSPVDAGYLAPDQLAGGIRALSGGIFDNKNKNGTVCKTPPVHPVENLGPGVVDSILSPATIRGLILAAKAKGSYYTSQPPTTAAMEGLVVIQTTEQIEFKDVYNGDGWGIPSSSAPKPPGFMLVIGPGAPDAVPATPSGGVFVQGNAKYYGILYTDGGMFGNGGTWVVGMLLSKNAIDLAGNREVSYDDRCVVGALGIATLNAQVVPNTWREIGPK